MLVDTKALTCLGCLLLLRGATALSAEVLDKPATAAADAPRSLPAFRADRDLHQAQGHYGAVSAPGISVRLSNAGDGNDAAPNTPRPRSPRP